MNRAFLTDSLHRAAPLPSASTPCSPDHSHQHNHSQRWVHIVHCEYRHAHTQGTTLGTPYHAAKLGDGVVHAPPVGRQHLGRLASFGNGQCNHSNTTKAEVERAEVVTCLRLGHTIRGIGLRDHAAVGAEVVGQEANVGLNEAHA